VSEKTRVVYLCDGMVPDCRKTFCYKRGGKCRHTADASHALNPADKRKFEQDDRGHLFEMDNPRQEGKTGTSPTLRRLAHEARNFVREHWIVILSILMSTVAFIRAS